MTFEELQTTNRARCEEDFRCEVSTEGTPGDGLDRWSITDWCCALAGEAGEAANIAKKMRRVFPANKRVKGDVATTELGAELADVVIYADLIATALGFRLEDLVREKFNRVSTEISSAHKLP